MSMKDDFQKQLIEAKPQINRVLVAAKSSVHRMGIHAWAEGGLELLDLGNGYGLQIIADGSNYVTVQLWKYAINQVPKQQTWVKRVFQKSTAPVKTKPEKKNETPKFEHKAEVKEI